LRGKKYFFSKPYLDISSSLPFLGNSRAEELIRIYGAERILFGSDYPMWNPLSCLDDFMKLRLTNREQELILHKNALRIVGSNSQLATEIAVKK
jgi:predicted TIM-barrel fold metal-dependent hydrolase